LRAPRRLRCAAEYASVQRMREPYRSGINYPLLFLVIAAHAGLFAWALQPPRAQPLRPRATTQQPAPPAIDATAQRDTTPPAPPRDAASGADTQAGDDSDDALRAISAQQWHDNQLAAQRKKLQARHAQWADAVQADPPAALGRLEQALRNSDPRAPGAVDALEEECRDDPARRRAALDAVPASLVENLSADGARAVRALIEAQRQLLAERARRCAAWQAARERLQAALRDYARGDSAPARLQALRQELDVTAPAPPAPGLFERLLQLLRETWQRDTAADVPLALARQLLAADDATRRRLGLELLEQTARDNDRYAPLVAAFLRSADAREFPPAREAEWTERAALLGDDASLRALLERPHQAQGGDAAWRWHAWRVWLNAQGCYAAGAEDSIALLENDLRALQALDIRLPAAQRGQAREAYRRQVAGWGARATALRDCGG
jgi:hypothetical protein